MARRSADIEMKGSKGPRQRVWDVIRARAKEFSVPPVSTTSGVVTETVRSYVQSLERAGIVEAINSPHVIGEHKRYRLVRDTGAEAPRVNRRGELVVAARSHENMWQSMRFMKIFTARDLVLRSSVGGVVVSEQTAKAYVRALARTGYLVVIDPAHGYVHGKGAKQARYQLTRRTGPHPPIVQRNRTVYDPNTGKTAWQEGAHGE